MIEYGFEEGKDFCSILSESTGGRPEKNHVLNLDMAKELCMLQRNERGKQARKYFIEVEKEYNSPEKVIARALVLAEKQIKNLLPYAEFGQSITESEGCILFGEFAKVCKNAGINIGQNRLFDWMRENGFIARSGNRKNEPKQRYVEMGVLALKERKVTVGDQETIKCTPLITGRGQEYFLNKLRIAGY